MNIRKHDPIKEDEMQDRIAVYVPTKRGAPPTDGIAPGSGIVGKLGDYNELVVYFEGNLYGYANVVTFADRVRIAAERMLVTAPTVAKMHVSSDWFQQVGWFDVEAGLVEILNGAAYGALLEWTGLASLSHEVRCSTSTVDDHLDELVGMAVARGQLQVTDGEAWLATRREIAALPSYVLTLLNRQHKDGPALDRIAELLADPDWSGGDMLPDIDEIVRNTGRVVEHATV